MFEARMAAVRSRMDDDGVDVLLVSVGADLPYLTGYEAMPLERLTMLVVPRGGAATLVVPRLEAPRVVEQPEVFDVRAWDEIEDPVDIVATLGGRPRRVAIGDQTWARFVLALQDRWPTVEMVAASTLTGPLRAQKDATEVAALRAAARAVDAVVADMATRPFAGRTEVDLSREFVERMLDAGHDEANFAIVASGPNGASPHHTPGRRVVEAGDVVVCDFGGRMAGYCSDITRTFVVGEAPDGFAEAFAVLEDAQRAAVEAVRPGATCASVDAAARRRIAQAGYGDAFIHRTGHGIGLEAHEEPYIVEGNVAVLRPGHAFSVEPGIYFPGRFGMRIEDIVVVTDSGVEALNTASHAVYEVA